MRTPVDNTRENLITHWSVPGGCHSEGPNRRGIIEGKGIIHSEGNHQWASMGNNRGGIIHGAGAIPQIRARLQLVSLQFNWWVRCTNSIMIHPVHVYERGQRVTPRYQQTREKEPLHNGSLPIRNMRSYLYPV